MTFDFLFLALLIIVLFFIVLNRLLEIKKKINNSENLVNKRSIEDTKASNELKEQLQKTSDDLSSKIITLEDKISKINRSTTNNHDKIIRSNLLVSDRDEQLGINDHQNFIKSYNGEFVFEIENKSNLSFAIGNKHNRIKESYFYELNQKNHIDLKFRTDLNLSLKGKYIGDVALPYFNNKLKEKEYSSKSLDAILQIGGAGKKERIDFGTISFYPRKYLGRLTLILLSKLKGIKINELKDFHKLDEKTIEELKILEESSDDLDPVITLNTSQEFNNLLYSNLLYLDTYKNGENTIKLIFKLIFHESKKELKIHDISFQDEIGKKI